MKQILTLLTVIALVATTVQAQDSKIKKKAAVAAAKETVVGDKAALKVNEAARDADKSSGNGKALKADRKEAMKKHEKLLKDQVKKDVKVVKEKL